MNTLSESELRKFISNYEKHNLLEIKSALIELKKRGGSIGSGFLENIAKYYKLENTDLLFFVEESHELGITNKEIKVSPEEQFRAEITGLVSKYREGFGYILFSVVSIIATSFISFILISDSRDVESLKSYSILFSLVYLILSLLGLIGLYTLYNASKISIK